MNKKELLKKINKETANELLEVKAILTALISIQDANYPANVLLDIASKKIKKIFYNHEKSGKIVKING